MDSRLINSFLKNVCTRSSHGGKHPALSVFDWLRSVAQVVLEDFGASSPDPRANSIFERAFPFAFQQSKAFVGVDLCVQKQMIEKSFCIL